MGTKKKTPRKRSRTAGPPRRPHPAKVAAKKRRGKTRARRATKRRKPAAPRIGREAVDLLERKVRRLRSARARLELRLTEAVQEIGTLRQFELRARTLEGALRKREEDLAAVRRELESLLDGRSTSAARP